MSIPVRILRGCERARGGEQAIGDLAQALLENPLFSQASRPVSPPASKALGAQHAAMGALNLPSASEVERLERRLRSLSQRLETVEEQVDRMARDVGGDPAARQEPRTVRRPTRSVSRSRVRGPRPSTSA